MFPADTRIPVHNTSEGIRLSGKDAPLNKDLADWLKDNSGKTRLHCEVQRKCNNGNYEKKSNSRL